MTRPSRLLLWAGSTGLLLLGFALFLHAGEGRLLAGFTAGFLAAVLLYFLYPLSSDPEPGPSGRPATAAEAVAAPANRTLDEMLQRPGSNESMLNVILNSMGEGVLLLNQADRVVLMNPSAEKILGLQVRDARGRHYLEVLRHPVLSDLLARAKSGGGLAAGELEFSSRDEKTFAVSAAAIRVAEGALLGQIMVFSDISSLKKLMRMRTDFAANVSHELKTPLTAILGYVETLLAGAIDDKKNRVQFLGKISAQAQRLHALIADVLQLSAIESGSYLEASEAVDLSEVAQQAVELLKAKWQARGIRVLQEVPAGRMVWGQKEGLFHVVENLLDNAVKYSPPKSRVVLASAELPDGRVELSVKDEGPGIPEEAQGRIFERFFRVDEARSRETGGTGLGLSIVKHLVDRMNGEIRLESRTGKGSTFRILLPAPPGA